MASVSLHQEYESGLRRRTWTFYVDVGYNSEATIWARVTGYGEYERESKRHKWKRTLEYVPPKHRPTGYCKYIDTLPELPPDALDRIKENITSRLTIKPAQATAEGGGKA